MRYRILRADGPEELEFLAAGAIREGWRPLGGIAVAGASSDEYGWTLLQAMGMFVDVRKAADELHNHMCSTHNLYECLPEINALLAAVGTVEHPSGSGPLPGRDVTVVQTPEKTLFVRKPEEE